MPKSRQTSLIPSPSRRRGDKSKTVPRSPKSPYDINTSHAKTEVLPTSPVQNVSLSSSNGAHRLVTSASTEGTQSCGKEDLKPRHASLAFSLLSGFDVNVLSHGAGRGINAQFLIIKRRAGVTNEFNCLFCLSIRDAKRPRGGIIPGPLATAMIC